MEDIANGATNQAGEMQKVNEQISDMNEAIAETTKNVENLHWAARRDGKSRI